MDFSQADQEAIAPIRVAKRSHRSNGDEGHVGREPIIVHSRDNVAAAQTTARLAVDASPRHLGLNPLTDLSRPDVET